MSHHPFQLFCRKRLRKTMDKRAAQGYGVALLIIFLTSSILIATSTSMILSPAMSNYVGSMSMDDSSAKQLAEEALDAAQADILSKQASGTAITTAYRYPSSGTNNISMPTYPASGSNVVKGTYYVTATYARGYSFVLNATVTVGANTTTVSRLLQLSYVPSILDSAIASFSLRKVKSSYSGYAVKVRCASNPSGATTQDIGFTASGDFDIAGLRTCLGDSALPLDAVAGAKAAYGLRKLRSAYSGAAINVRRSSDATTQDIGFDSNGNLDTVALKTFVGTGNGFVKIWYDQSGNGLDETQTTNSKQPRIVSGGVIDTKNNAPALYFTGTRNLANNSFSGVITGQALRAFIVAEAESSGADWGQFACLYKSGDPDSYETPDSMEVLSLGSPTTNLAVNSNYYGSSMTHTLGLLFQATSYHDSSGNIKLFYDGTLGVNEPGSNNLAPTSLILGTGAGSDATSFVTGYMAEIILYNSNLSSANQTKIERSQGHYYNIASMQDGFVTTWYDQSGNGRNATQTTTTSQPVLLNVGTMFGNGTIRPAIQFDGSDDYLATATSTAWPSGSADRTLSALYQQTSTVSGQVVFGWGTVGTGTYSSIFHDPTVGFWGFNADVKSSITPSTTYAQRITVVKSGSTVTVYSNGASAASGTPTLNTTANTVLRIGQSDWGDDFVNGNEAEILIFNKGLSSSELTQLETSQTTYYGQ